MRSCFQYVLAGLIACLIVVSDPLPSQAEDWPRFRGPNGTGQSQATGLPQKWTANDYRWTQKLVGSGSSAPVIWGNRLFVTSCDSETAEFFVECLDVNTGQQAWKTSFSSEPYRIHRRNSYASSTPAVDQDHLYVTYASPDHTYLVALDHQGKEVWRRDFGRWVSQHGFGASPMVYRDKVVLINSQQAERLPADAEPGQSRVIAVDRLTGKDVWTTELASTRANYSVPCVFSLDGRDQLIACSTAEGFFSLDPETGQFNWKMPAFKMRTVASPVLEGNLVLGSTGSGGGGNYLVAARLGDQGAEKLFEVTQAANYVPCPIVCNGLVFLFSDKGIASCVDPASGEVVWKKRVAKGFSGSPVATAEHVYVTAESGDVLVLPALRDFQEPTINPLGEESRSTPAIANGCLFFRTDTQLFCLGKAATD
ncbi:MAG: PQQ-binding-like beta-propeller repeat protein [Mariniblastus sp.]|nr:PQQ-binding-like beta-propeller repeat protein [Mariniblastus sp.]